MKLPQEAITEFQALYLKKYGRELTVEEAQEQATELLNLFALSQGYKIL